MARRVYRSRSRSADRTAESEWHNGGLSGADPTDRTAGGLRGWDDDSDDGKFQLKVPKNLASASGWKVELKKSKPAGSQEIFLRPAVTSTVRLSPGPGGLGWPVEDKGEKLPKQIKQASPKVADLTPRASRKDPDRLPERAVEKAKLKRSDQADKGFERQDTQRQKEDGQRIDVQQTADTQSRRKEEREDEEEDGR